MSDNPPDPGAVERLFDEVCELSPEGRSEALEASGASPAVRRRVEHLLANLDVVEGGKVELGVPALAFETSTVPDRIGPYSIRGVLGTGGMGVVYLAEQETPQRAVAVKVLRWLALGPEMTRRFAREAELLGRLQHPGIAQIFESGTTDGPEGQATYIAMEYVDRTTLAEYADATGLNPTARVRLLVELIRAVHHAHLRGVLHRDLKPSNVLVTAGGEVKVIDFGVARALDSQAAGTLATTAGQVIGTLAYMSPEQVRGDIDRVDARTDVYALGVIAYEFLSGRLPHDVRHKPIPEVARLLNDVDPPRLGTITTVCRGDLERIVGKALEKEPERRYQSAAALADDFERHLNFQPIDARPPSAVYQFGKLARRHRIAVGGVAVALLAILVGAFVALRYAIVNADLARAEGIARGDAQRLASSEAEARSRADDSAARAQKQATLAAEKENEARRLAGVAEVRAAELEKVASFRLAQVRYLKIAQMGVHIRESLIEGLESKLGQAGVSAEAIARELSAFKASLDRANTTDAARQTLKRTLLDPTLKAIEIEFAGQPPLHLRMLLAHATLAAELNLSSDAEAAYLAAVDVSQAIGEEHADSIYARIGLGYTYVLQGRWDEAEALLLPAVETGRDVLALGDEMMIVALGQLAILADVRGDVESVEAFFGEQLEHAHAGYQPGDVGGLFKLLQSMQNFGTCLISREKFEEAEEIVAHAEILLEDHGRGNPDLDLAVKMLRAKYLARAGQPEAAEPLCREIVELARRDSGTETDFFLVTLLNLAEALTLQGKYAEAEPVRREIVGGWLRIGGESHPNVVTATRDLAENLQNQGKQAEARALLDLVRAND